MLGRSSYVNYLHRLGFVLKRPKKRLFKTNHEKREAVIAFPADLRGKCVPKGEPSMGHSTSLPLLEKATYCSAVCLETRMVELIEAEVNCNAETSAAFLQQLHGWHHQPLIVLLDNGQAHHGNAIRDYLKTPDLMMRLVLLPDYCPDSDVDEAN